MPWHSKVGIWAQYVLYGTIILYIALTFISPEDIFTTALFVDSSGIRSAFSDPTIWFGPGARWFATEQGVSRGAFGVSIMVFFTQLVLSFLIMVRTSYWLKTNRGEARSLLKALVSVVKIVFKKERLVEFSYDRLGLALAWLGTALLDTYTDAHFRSWSRTSTGVFTTPEEMWSFALIFSFVVYTIGSEVFIALGFDLIATGIVGYLNDRGETTSEYINGLIERARGLVSGESTPRHPQSRGQSQRARNKGRNRREELEQQWRDRRDG